MKKLLIQVGFLSISIETHLMVLFLYSTDSFSFSVQDTIPLVQPFEQNTAKFLYCNTRLFFIKFIVSSTIVHCFITYE